MTDGNPTQVGNAPMQYQQEMTAERARRRSEVAREITTSRKQSRVPSALNTKFCSMWLQSQPALLLRGPNPRTGPEDRGAESL